VSDELGLYLPAQDGGVSARQAKNVLSHLLTALDNLTAYDSRNDWTLSKLQLGSLELAIAPAPKVALERRAELVRASGDFVYALGLARTDAVLPSHWPQAAARAAQLLLRTLGPSGDARIFVRHDGQVVRTLIVDEAAITGLDRALSGLTRGYGSVTGHLRELDDGRSLTAQLVRSDGRYVTVDYRPDQVDEIRSAWRRHRVEVTGHLTMDVGGDPTRIAMEAIEVLPEEADLSLSDVAGGFYEGITGGLSDTDYVRLIRGES
jgi:hypothetical protein